jgi:hypothetical protein
MPNQWVEAADKLLLEALQLLAISVTPPAQPAQSQLPAHALRPITSPQETFALLARLAARLVVQRDARFARQ